MKRTTTSKLLEFTNYVGGTFNNVQKRYKALKLEFEVEYEF